MLRSLTPAKTRRSARPRRQQVHRTERVIWGRLPAARRAALLNDMLAIFAQSFEPMDPAVFEQSLLSVPDTQVVLCFGKNGELAGYSQTTIACFTDRGRRHAVIRMGVVFRRDYAGANRAGIPTIKRAIAYMLRHPRTRVAFVSPVISPAMYTLMLRHGIRAYPHRDRPTPPRMHHLMGQAIKALGLTAKSEQPWIIQTGIAHRTSDWLSTARTLRDNPDVRFFEQHVPGWVHGDGLFIWMDVSLRAFIKPALSVLFRR
jgi:hypothetical protein